MTNSTTGPSPRTLALVGTVLLLPTLLLVSASILKYQLGVAFVYDTFESLIRAVDSPVVILGGLLGATLLNLWPTVRLSLKRDSDAVVGTVTVRRRGWNLAAVATSVVLLGMILTYLVGENLRHGG